MPSRLCLDTGAEKWDGLKHINALQNETENKIFARLDLDKKREDFRLRQEPNTVTGPISSFQYYLENRS